jgi:hypothetical protein
LWGGESHQVGADIRRDGEAGSGEKDVTGWGAMKRNRIATARFTAPTYGQGPTEDRQINAGAPLIFLHRSNDGLSTFFAVENDMQQLKLAGKTIHPLEYIVATEIFDSSTREAE